MQLADPMIEQPQTQLVHTYEDRFDLEGVFVSAESQFEHASLTMIEDGWKLKHVSHQGTIVSPRVIVVATYVC